MYSVSSENSGPVYCVTSGYQVGATNRSWRVVDTYSYGIGYDDSYERLPRKDDQDWAIDNPRKKLGELVSTVFNYTGVFSAEEKEHIEWAWEQARNLGQQDKKKIFEGEWGGMLTTTLVIPGPFKVHAVATHNLNQEYREVPLDFRSYLRKIAIVA